MKRGQAQALCPAEKFNLHLCLETGASLRYNTKAIQAKIQNGDRIRPEAFQARAPQKRMKHA